MNQQLLDRLRVSPQLPSLPAIAVRALELARSENVNIGEIAGLISNDPALSSKILKTVNSSFYGLSQQVSTISHALVILGLQSVKTLALGFTLLPNLQKTAGPDGFDYMQFWKRSIYSAVASRLLAKKLAIVQQEEAFLAGLLADVGTLVMHRALGAEYDVVHAEACGDQEKLIALSRERLGIDHSMVGAMLAEQWQLPPVLSRPIACHHDPVETDPVLKPIVEVVYAGAIMGDVFASAEPAPLIVRAREELTTRFGLSADDVELLLTQIGSSTRDVAKLFDLHIGKSSSYQEILNEAQQTLIQLTLRTQQQVQAIQRENESLQLRATTDSLTGLANRMHLNEFFEEQFRRAYNYQRPLAVLFLDVDRFKEVNDTYGHHAGDEVLRRIGSVLRRSARKSDMAGRYGGEEFVMVLPETDSNAAARMADDLRRAMQVELFLFDRESLHVTVSIGVAGTDGTRIFTEAGQLLRSADRAMYAAKAGGRNCVRLFRPKVRAVSEPTAV